MTTKNNYLNNVIIPYTLTIANGDTDSEAFDCGGVTLKTIIMPSAFTGTEITFKISPDGVTYYDYYNIDNVKASITCSAGRAYGLGAIDFYSIKFLKIISNAAEAADRDFILLTKSI